MKNQSKIIIVIAVLFISTTNIKAQNNAIIDINAQLRGLFSPLAKPNPSLEFLYDMSAKVSDSVFYTTFCKDTLETPMWQSIYDEMYHTAYDTSWLPIPDDFFLSGNNFYSDTIPMGILNFGFYKFLDDAMTTNIYFNFDTVNDILTDKYPRPGFPYIDSNLFVAAPMIASAQFSNPVYRVDPQFILFDALNAGIYLHGEGILKIDFGDGNGWIQFDPTIITNWHVQYASAGEKLIQTAIFDHGNDMLFYSLSRIVIVSGTASIPPDQYIESEGLIVGYYGGCNSQGISAKTVIYLSGIDILDFIPSKNRTIATIYSEMIKQDNIVQLKNQGYGFIVVDYANSRIDVRFNALYFVNLLENLKCLLQDINQQQFVVMGESMGGLVARFALTYMESEYYMQQNTSPFFVDQFDLNNIPYLALHPNIYNMPSQWCRTEKMHNTRLFITLDTPHQGANIPMSMQYAYKTGIDVLSRFISFDLRLLTNAFNLFLDGQAAQQMLIYHIDTKSGSPFYYNYDSKSDKYFFFDQLNALENYPQYAKVIAMSQGSMSGEMQRNNYTGSDRNPGDRLLDFSADLYARVLWLKVPIFGGDLECKTNPNGNGHIFLAQAGWYGIRIKLKWFGIKVTIGYNSLLYVNEYANLLPYCVNPGGIFGDPDFISTTPSQGGFNLSNNYWLLNFFHCSHTVNGNGCVDFDSHLGLNGFLSTNFDYSLCSDGLQFGFVPVQSALDYGVLGGIPLNFDIVSENINTKLSNTPTDMMIGAYNNFTATYPNLSHVGFRNNYVYNITDQPNNGPHFCTYYSCIGNNENVERSLLNSEIGDENLFLENVTLHWETEYQPEYDMFVNVRNPRYEYPSQPYSNLNYMFLGVYSKEDPYIIDNSGYATFYFDGANTPTGTGFVYDPPYTGNYNHIDQPLSVCCENFMERKANTTKKKPNLVSSLEIFPNPNDGQQVVLNFRFKEYGQVNFSLYNSTGILIGSEILKTKDASTPTTSVLNLSNRIFTSGLYYIQLISDKGETLSQKLLINK
ncbi:MAG TPA: T9SS type A sorting domain-containing protein [Bacteroidia bacterium]|nr:T9SS type A sorting domain-containing protein [Bacteroidia bacterium]